MGVPEDRVKDGDFESVEILEGYRKDRAPFVPFLDQFKVRFRPWESPTIELGGLPEFSVGDTLKVAGETWIVDTVDEKTGHLTATKRQDSPDNP